ncbi:putative porin [uncultured Winogradskyella sp.]|uniref:putative porin n=1 Tax=uncultured Winogradskyella sp. TaxID=395353 RepID=UPI00261A8A98|nr:putative porin [uncultured Winogradskyella sp.]
MNRLLICFFLLIFSVNAIAQKKFKNKAPIVSDTLKTKSSKSSKTIDKKPSIKKYLILDFKNDTTYVDTTLTIKKEYKYNYLRKDNFNSIQFANTGQTYNTLSLDASTNHIIPLFSAQARHFNYMEIEDINYYHVPTPLTELYFKTVFSQGQNLDAFFTVNTSKQFNFSIAYKGLRSLGNYQNALTSTGNFRFTTNYKTKNGKYGMRGHVTMQDLLNQENGGLTDVDVQRFKDGVEEIIDRSVFDPNFENAENILEGKRFHLEQAFSLISKVDSTSNTKLSLTNTVSFEDKFYEFNQTSADNDFFGTSFSNSIADRVTLEDFYTDFGILFKNNIVGDIKFKLSYNDVNYGYNSLVTLSNQTITNRIKANFFGFKGAYQKQLGDFLFNGEIGANLSEEIKGNFINAKVGYKLSDNLYLEGKVDINSRLPNYNHLLYQSDYTNYNWDNQSSFNNIKTQQIAFSLKSKKYGSASADISNIDNYTYFNLQSIDNNTKVIKPAQYTESIQYLRLKIQKEFRLGKFALDNTIMYQNVTSNDNVLNVPSLITRNTLYYSDEVFKKSLKFQTGITLNYFSKYNGNGYDPLLAEFYTQNQTEIGGFPRLDFFINAKVRQTRIYLKAEHFNSSFTGYDYFSAPNNPYRDFTVRFGLVWNFFL